MNRGESWALVYGGVLCHGAEGSAGQLPLFDVTDLPTHL